MVYFTIFLIICSSCFVNGNFHSGFTSEEKTIFELGSQLASLGSPEIKIKRLDSNLLNIYVGWNIFIGKDRSYLQFDEYGSIASTLDFNVYGIKGNFKFNPMSQRQLSEGNFKFIEGKISSCDECFLHADIQMNLTSNRDQTKVDILFSNIHGYPRNGMFDGVPFIRLKDQKEIEATLKFVIPNNAQRSNDPLNLRSTDYPPKNARVDFALKVKGDIANPLHETNIRKPNYGSKFAPGTYLFSASAKITHDGPVTIRSFTFSDLKSHEYKSVIRIDLKDEIEYEDGRLNVVSKFEGMDEIVTIDSMLSGEAWGWMGDSDFFSLSVKNVNKGIEYGNLRAFFKTQDHFRMEFGMLGLKDSVGDLTTMSLNLNATPNSTEIYLEGDEYSFPNQCSEFYNFTPTNNFQENNETEIDLEDARYPYYSRYDARLAKNSTDSSLTPHLFPIIFGESDLTLHSNECNKYKIWESIDRNDEKITRWYNDFLQFFGEYVTGKYYYYPRERQNKSQVVEQIIEFIDNGYVIQHSFSTPNSNTFLGLMTHVHIDGHDISNQIRLNDELFIFDLQLHDGLDRYSAKLIKVDLVDGDEPIIDATIYDSGTAKTLFIIFDKLVPIMMNVTSLTRSNAESIMDINIASIWSYFNMLEQGSCPKTCMCQTPPRDLPGRRNVQGSGAAKGYCFHWCDPIGFCGVGEVAKTQGRDCRPCRMKFYGY